MICRCDDTNGHNTYNMNNVLILLRILIPRMPMPTVLRTHTNNDNNANINSTNNTDTNNTTNGNTNCNNNINAKNQQGFSIFSAWTPNNSNNANTNKTNNTKNVKTSSAHITNTNNALITLLIMIHLQMTIISSLYDNGKYKNETSQLQT